MSTCHKLERKERKTKGREGIKREKEQGERGSTKREKKEKRKGVGPLLTHRPGGPQPRVDMLWPRSHGQEARASLWLASVAHGKRGEEEGNVGLR